MKYKIVFIDRSEMIVDDVSSVYISASQSAYLIAFEEPKSGTMFVNARQVLYVRPEE
jgi:hypothetical protein